MQNNISITYEQVLALFAEAAMERKETEKLVQETAKEQKITEKMVQETAKELQKTEKLVLALSKQIGGITDAMGLFAEEQVRLKVLNMFQKRGIDLEEVYQRVSIKQNGQVVTEIDLLLVNTIYSVIVEVKHTLRQKDVEDHLERMKILQDKAHKITKGTTMFGAVAGMIVKDEVERFAFKNGLFVIKLKGESVEISNEKKFIPKEWKVNV